MSHSNLHNFQEQASSTSEIAVRRELEKYIKDLETAVLDMDGKCLSHCGKLQRLIT